MPRYDYTSMVFTRMTAGLALHGSATGWRHGVFTDELTLAVSGAAGTVAIAAAKMGIKTLAVGGVGDDIMADWVLARLKHFGVDTWGMQQKPGWKTSSSIVTTRADGSRPALHMKGATKDFVVSDDMYGRVTDCTVFHAGGRGEFRTHAEFHEDAIDQTLSFILPILEARQDAAYINIPRF